MGSRSRESDCQFRLGRHRNLAFLVNFLTVQSGWNIVATFACPKGQMISENGGLTGRRRRSQQTVNDRVGS
jgi:hypothetical protein